MDTVSEFHAEAHRQLPVKDLPKVPIYVAARAGVELTTLRLRAIDSTKAPSRPTEPVRGIAKSDEWEATQTRKHVNIGCADYSYRYRL